MTNDSLLAKAPIVEALIDIRAALPDSITVDDLADFISKDSKTYPSRELRTVWTGQFEFRPNADPIGKTSGGPNGWMFRSADGKQVVQARTDGFTFSRLQPYTSWKLFSEEGRRHWTAYAKRYKPMKPTRVALRYVNRIHIPLPIRDLKDYILTVPEIAPGLPQGMANYFFRIVLPDDKAQATAIISQTIESESTHKGTLPLIFDIDVFREGTFPLESAQIASVLDSLRELKNRIFFESLTPAAKELFR